MREIRSYGSAGVSAGNRRHYPAETEGEEGWGSSTEGNEGSEGGSEDKSAFSCAEVSAVAELFRDRSADGELRVDGSGS